MCAPSFPAVVSPYTGVLNSTWSFLCVVTNLGKHQQRGWWVWVGIRVQFHVFLILWCSEKSPARRGSWTCHWVSPWGVVHSLSALMGSGWLCLTKALAGHWSGGGKTGQSVACSWTAQLTDGCRGCTATGRNVATLGWTQHINMSGPSV